MEIGGHEIELSNLDKVYFPEAELSKGDLIGYYEQVAEVMIPHMRRYGVSMQRFPDGLSSDGFYNKDAPDYFPDWIKTVNFPKREGGSFDAPIVDDKAVLVYLANQGVITFHLYLSREDDLEHPDKMVFDLDPPEGTEDFGQVRKAALDMRDVLMELDLKSWVQTTGSKGFHVLVPLDQQADFDEVREFAQGVARLLAYRHEDRYTIEQRKDKRQRRIFLDYLRNSYGATAVAPYSVRARTGATVATPLDWDEVRRGASPRDWDIMNIPNRLAQKNDPWSGLMRHSFALSKHRDALEKLVAQEKSTGEKKNKKGSS
jgi:bifunctional non-homologous end joining protein LigD